jgi:hypothetical protein
MKIAKVPTGGSSQPDHIKSNRAIGSLVPEIRRRGAQ